MKRYIENTPNEQTNRRDFLKVSAAAGAGLLISVYLAGCKKTPASTTAQPIGPTAAPSETTSPITPAESTSIPEAGPYVELQPNVFLKIDSNGQVTITASKPELGTGTRTALPMIVAEELDADWTKIRIEQAPAGNEYLDQSVGGSDSISGMFTALRKAGAAARALMIAAAAQIWDVEASSCKAENGEVIHPPSDRRLGYGDLAGTAAEIDLPKFELKNHQDFHLIGTRTARIDNPQIVDGSAIFGSDVTLPGMLYAVVARPSRQGNKADNINEAKALAVPGVRQVVEIERGIAVVAENTWQALKGREALEVSWREGQATQYKSRSMEIAALKHPDYFAKRMETQYPLAYLDSTMATQQGNALSQTYSIPHFAHATMEPMNCVADVREGVCIVWAPTQVPMEARAAARTKSKVRFNDDVRVNLPLVGGGFGRRLEVDYVEEAVEISKAVGAPVKLFWTREDDIQYDFLHPRSSVVVQASLERAEMPKLRISSGGTPVQTGAWRAVSNFDEAFARECFLDEYAEALGRDPVELRLEVYRDPGLKAVLEKATREAGWGTPLPEGWARGVACFSTWDVAPVAEVAEVSIDADGKIRVHRVVCAVDCGIVVNPDMVEQQMEGGIAFALSAALGNEITLEEGKVVQSNFDDYPILRMEEMPVVEVHILPSERGPAGVGEMGGPPIAPAVANAVYAITRTRMRQLPLRA